MNGNCANATSQPVWNKTKTRIVHWMVTCPECGTLATHMQTAEAIEVEHAHRMEGERLRTDTPITTPVTWARLRIS